MNFERAFLVTFFGNYIINTLLSAVVALMPASTSDATVTPQYIVFVVLAVIAVALLCWWYMKGAAKDVKNGAYFGALGFVMAIVVAFVSGIAGVLSQTGSFQAIVDVLPNFWPFLANWSTLVLLAYWVLPAAGMGWWMARGSAMPAPARPMGSM